MNYNHRVHGYHPGVASTSFSEPDCSPHPFDVMAIYALYQRVPRASISGPYSGRELTNVRLTADVSAGVSPYTYKWSSPKWSGLVFSPNDTSSSVSIYLPDVDASDSVDQREVPILLHVTDANGSTAQVEHVVTVNP